ncbi:FMN-dependent NADH-azoreductase [Flavobacterium sp.]|uniref:FMN-dependent NADH-azoreductase n=1 Tax=Flavobacterium sp. TaxID=239 RepID=UPI00374DD976
MKLLHIIASPRGEKSRTTRIANEFINSLKSKHPNLIVEDLELFQMDLPTLNQSVTETKYMTIAGATLDTASQFMWNEIADISKSFVSFDMYVISAPMWNFSVPYKLKHYIDVIMQPGILFKFTATGVEGLAKNKKMICITSRGSDYSVGSPMNVMDFQESYLRTIFGFAGITDVSFVNAQPLDYTPDLATMKINEANKEASDLAATINF